jgi:hypothetical protein
LEVHNGGDLIAETSDAECVCDLVAVRGQNATTAPLIELARHARQTILQ